jgi:DNA-binding transcriptional ArsR family regulator
MDVEALNALRRMGSGERGVEETVSYAVGHRIRIEILAALHEGPKSAADLAKVVREPLSTVNHHIEELLVDGSIEIAWAKPIRANMTQNFYRVVELPEFSKEEVEEMSPEERQALFALIAQATTAETLASLWAGKMIYDPDIVLAWNWFNLDAQGRKDLAQEQNESWDRVKDIAGDSANRMANSKEKGVTYVVTMFGFQRCRPSAPQPSRQVKTDR